MLVNVGPTGSRLSSFASKLKGVKDNLTSYATPMSGLEGMQDGFFTHGEGEDYFQPQSSHGVPHGGGGTLDYGRKQPAYKPEPNETRGKKRSKTATGLYRFEGMELSGICGGKVRVNKACIALREDCMVASHTKKCDDLVAGMYINDPKMLQPFSVHPVCPSLLQTRTNLVRRFWISALRFTAGLISLRRTPPSRLRRSRRGTPWRPRMISGVLSGSLVGMLRQAIWRSAWPT